MTPPASIDDYLASLPDGHRAALERIRARVKALVPDAVEAISYGLPAFKLHGRGLVWFAGWKAHCSIYPLTDAFAAAHPDELRGYRQGKGTLQFPLDSPLPDPLLDALIHARVADVEAEAAAASRT